MRPTGPAIALGLALGAALLAACAGGRGNAAPTTATSPDVEPPVVVLALPFTGPQAALGASAEAAVRAVLRLNGATPGVALRPVDVGGADGSDPQRCSDAGAAAAADGRVVAVVGPLDDACAVELARATGEQGPPLVIPGLTSDPARDLGPAVRMVVDAGGEGSAAAALAAALGARRVAVLEDGSATAAAIGEGAAAASAGVGIELVASERYGAEDAGAALTRALASEPDALLVLGDASTAGLDLLRARADDADAAALPAILTDGFAAPALLGLPAPALARVRVLFPGASPQTAAARGGAAAELADVLATAGEALEPFAPQAAAAAQLVVAAAAASEARAPASRRRSGLVRVDAAASATGAELAVAPDGGPTVRDVTVLVPAGTTLRVERTVPAP